MRHGRSERRRQPARRAPFLGRGGTMCGPGAERALLGRHRRGRSRWRTGAGSRRPRRRRRSEQRVRSRGTEQHREHDRPRRDHVGDVEDARHEASYHEAQLHRNGQPRGRSVRWRGPTPRGAAGRLRTPRTRWSSPERAPRPGFPARGRGRALIGRPYEPSFYPPLFGDRLVLSRLLHLTSPVIPSSGGPAP